MGNIPQDPIEYRAWWESNAPVPYGDCWCGCGTQTRGAPFTNRPFLWFKGEPMRYIHGHNAGKKTFPVVEYVVEDRGYITPCWVWQRQLTEEGYGRISVNGKVQRVHRYYYEHKYGPIPEDRELDHLCRIRSCCRPDHLEPVTGQVNKQRGAAAKLSQEKAAQIRELAKSGVPLADIATMFGVHRTTIGSVVKYESWN